MGLTEKKLSKIIEAILLDIPEDPQFVMFSGCRTTGIAKRTERDLNICDDLECTSCQDIVKALKEI